MLQLYYNNTLSRVFPVNFPKFFKTAFLVEHFWTTASVSTFIYFCSTFVTRRAVFFTIEEVFMAIFQVFGRDFK